MCWSAEVSFAFATIDALFISLVLYLRPKYWRAIALNVFIFFLMEVEEGSQWLWGDVIDKDPSDFPAILKEGCTRRNSLFSYAGWLLLHAQPLVFAISGAIVFTNTRSRYYFPILFLLGNLLMGTFHFQFSPDKLGVEIPETNWGQYSCTYRGKHGHLYWKWAFGNMEFQPSFATYSLGAVCTLLMYEVSALQLLTFTGFFGTYATAHFLMEQSPENPAFWCCISVLLVIPCSIYLMFAPREVDAVVTKSSSNGHAVHSNGNGTKKHN